VDKDFLVGSWESRAAEVMPSLMGIVKTWDKGFPAG